MNKHSQVAVSSFIVAIVSLVLFSYYFSLDTPLAFGHSSTPNIQEDSLVVIASPSSVSREGNVTITATVLAHRTGGSANTNWSIQLAIAPGYTIISGSNPQSKTTTSHGSAIVTWIVAAPTLPSGPDAFTITVSATDATLGTALSGSPEVDTLAVTTVNRSPTAYDDTITIAEDAGSTTINVLANDTDADNDTLLITSISSQPLNGTLEIADSNTTITYAPIANFHGTDSITYRIEDGYGGLASGTVTILVTPVNDAPVAATDSYELDEDTLLAVAGIGIIANDTDIENDTLSAILVQEAENGMLTLYSNGSFTYIPNSDLNGRDSFSYRANDGELDSNNAATVNITIAAVNDAPIANNAIISVAEDEQVVLTLEGSDLDDDILTFIITANPANGTLTAFNATSGTVTYSPAANFNGHDNFHFITNDGSANSTFAVVSILVNPVDEPEDADTDDEKDRDNNKSRRDPDEQELAPKRITYEDSHFDNKPLERVQIQSHAIVNSDGAAFASVTTGEKVTFSYTFRNYQQKTQPYYFIVQIADPNDITVGIQFVGGELAKGEIMQVQEAWIPDSAGAYSVKIFIWDHLEKPSPLADVGISTFRVR